MFLLQASPGKRIHKSFNQLNLPIVSPFISTATKSEGL
jgi:hypothetical protein